MDTSDQDHITEHPPSVDIDQYVTDCNFRIERMGEQQVWIAAYTDDKVDHHYDIYITEDGLHITHREEGELTQ